MNEYVKHVLEKDIQHEFKEVAELIRTIHKKHTKLKSNIDKILKLQEVLQVGSNENTIIDVLQLSVNEIKEAYDEIFTSESFGPSPSFNLEEKAYQRWEKARSE